VQNIKSTDRIRKKHTSRTWHDSDDTENYNTLFNKSNSTKKPVNIGHLPIWWLRHAHLILVGAPKSFTNKLQRVLNAAARTVTGIMIEDCHIYCILSCTGWTSRSGSCISLLWWSTDVSRTRRCSICQTTVCQSLKLPVVSNCDLPLVISFYWSHDIVSEHSAIGLLLWLARRSGTHWQMNCELTLVIGLN